MNISFIGLGLMGYPMAGHLAKKFPVTVWNRSAAKAAAHAQEFGSTQAVNLSEALKADIVFSCLPTSKEIKTLLPDILAHCNADTIWIDCTSGDPSSAREIAEALANNNIHYLDAPVSGGVGGAIRGQLTVMIGGDKEILNKTQAALETFAAKIVHVGPVGAGMAVKAANQALLATNILALAEVLLGLEKNGVKSSTALEVINASSGRSNVSQNLFPERVVGRSFPATFALALMAKDVRIAAQALRESKVPAPITGLVESLFEIALREVGGEKDHVAAAQLLERWAGQELGHE